MECQFFFLQVHEYVVTGRGFLDEVKEWQSYLIRGSSIYAHTEINGSQKGRHYMEVRSFGKVESRRSKSLNELLPLDQTTENRPQTQSEKYMMV